MKASKEQMKVIDELASLHLYCRERASEIEPDHVDEERVFKTGDMLFNAFLDINLVNLSAPQEEQVSGNKEKMQ
jgi:hypothetical protein